MFGLGFRGFERAGKNTDLGIPDFLSHLGVTHFLVHQNPVHQLSVGKRTSALAAQLDQFKINVFSFEVGHSFNGVFTNLGHIAFEIADDLGTQRSHGCGDEELVVILYDVDFIGDGL